MNITKGMGDGEFMNYVNVSDDERLSAVSKAVAFLDKKGALYPLTPTLYSSGAEGYVLTGFAKEELEEIAIKVDARKKTRQGRVP